MNEFVRSLVEPRVRAIIALGANLGDPLAAVIAAERELETLSDGPILRSGLYRTEPLECPPGSPPFINSVVCLTPRPNETPESLLERLAKLEKTFGRKPKNLLNESRSLDLDLISYGDQVRSTESLTLPHPRAHQRLFVLVPLSDIAPDLILPRQRRTVRELLQNFGPAQEFPKLVLRR